MTGNGTAAPKTERVDWVDYAKGICIVMVVMMHSVLGVQKAADQAGFMNLVVEFARPFRMPDFFLISGLFLPLVIDRGWRTYLDRKVVHFAYFYVLWVTIQFGFKAPSFAAEMGWPGVARLYLMSFIDPFGTLWFIYLLPVFFVVIKATRHVIPSWVIWSIAAILEMSHISTGWTLIDEFAARFVYIYSGYLFANYVFALSNRARAYPMLALGGLMLWAVTDAGLVYAGVSEWPVISLALGLVGACAIITIGTLLAKMHWLDVLRYFGQHSIVIYLSFFLPMAISRTVLLKLNVIHDVGWVSLIVTIAGVIGSVLMWWACRNTRLNFLYERPDAFWIAPKKRAAALQAAE